MPERSSVAVTTSIVSPPSCTCGGSKAIERSCGGVVSEFGSFGSFGAGLRLRRRCWIRVDCFLRPCFRSALIGFARPRWLASTTGAGGFVCGEAESVSAAASVVARPPAPPTARSRRCRRRATRGIAARAWWRRTTSSPLQARTMTSCAGPSAGSGSNVACGPVEPDVAEAVAAVVDDAADSVAVFTVYDRTRTINAVANATVSSVRKTERNEIWTRRRTRIPFS